MASPGAGVALPSNPSENQGPAILAATLTVTIAALITYTTRMYVRLIMIRNPGWDDWIMTLAMLISVAGAAVVIPEVSHGGGRHVGDVDPSIYMIGMELNFVTQPLYLIDICVVKLAVGASLLRIASTRFYRVLIGSIMGFMLFYTIGCFFTVIFQCTDIRIQWDPSIHGTCWTAATLKALSYTNVALNILTDLLFAIVIPTPMLWSLNVNRRTRYTIMAVLGLGVFACAAAFIKVGYLVNYGLTGDWLWDSRNITIWTAVESNVGIVAGSLPAVRPLLRNTWLRSTYETGSRSRPPGASGYGQSHPTSKSGNHWQTLSSGRRTGAGGVVTDETSSERAFNAERPDEYELGDRGDRQIIKTTIQADVEGKSSDEISDRVGVGGDVQRGAITKTTTMAMTFSKL